jgi:hypothetical protein
MQEDGDRNEDEYGRVLALFEDLLQIHRASPEAS